MKHVFNKFRDKGLSLGFPFEEKKTFSDLLGRAIPEEHTGKHPFL